MKLIIIPNLPYTYRDHLRFGTKYFLDRGYDVEVWDIHKILLPGYKEKVNIEYFTFENYFEINSFNELFIKAKQLSKDDYILFNFGSSRIEFLNKLKDNTHAKFIIHASGALPINGITFNVKKYSSENTKKFNTDIVFLASPKDKILYKDFITTKTRIIKANSRDYDLFLENSIYKYPKKYCTYIDTDAIDASDYVFSKNQAKVSKESYYKKLFSFLEFIENNFNLKVIIAAHPKSRKFFNRININGFKIEHFKTAELVKNSEFVINEGSAAISYAILNNKPLIFFSSEELSFFKFGVDMAFELKKKIINLSNFNLTQVKNELSNNFRYTHYKFNYITCEEKKQNTFEIMENYFKTNIINN